MNPRVNPCVDPAEAELRAGDDCMRVADDYTAIGEHARALMFARQAQIHYERAAAIRSRQSEVSQSEVGQPGASRSGASRSEAGQSPTGTTEAA